jgi:hypothetical protein
MASEFAQAAGGCARSEENSAAAAASVPKLACAEETDAMWSRHVAGASDFRRAFLMFENKTERRGQMTVSITKQNEKIPPKITKELQPS